MIRTYDTLKNYQLKSNPNGNKGIELYLRKFLDEKAKAEDEGSSNLHDYHVAKDGGLVWILEMNKGKTNYSFVSQRVIIPKLRTHKLRMIKHHFFFSIELDVSCLENEIDSIQIINEIDYGKGIQEKVILIDREVNIWQDFENGIKRVQIDRWVHDSIVKFCTELGISGYRFKVLDYNYQVRDSTAVAVYYTVINCLADIFGLKPRSELITGLSDLEK